MSYLSLGQQGLDAVEAGQWGEAIVKLSRALRESASPTWLVARSKALIHLGRFREALDDADVAWHRAFARGRRHSLVAVNYRRAVAYYRMGQYANADCCCLYALRLVEGFSATEATDPKVALTNAQGFWLATLDDATREAREGPGGKGVHDLASCLAGHDDADGTDGGSRDVRVADEKKDSWPVNRAEWNLAASLRILILRAMEKLPADDEARRATVSRGPAFKKVADVAPKDPAEGSKGGGGGEASAATQTHDSATKGTESRSPAQAETQPLQLQEFQSNTVMSVSIFSKGVDKDKLRVEFLASAVHLDPVVYPGGSQAKFSLFPWADIVPSECSYTVTRNKVELRLAKATPGKWPQLQRENQDDAAPAGGDAPPSGARRGEDKEKEVGESATAPPSEPPQASSSHAQAEASTSTGPSYPTSARGGPKDWDRIGSDEVGDDKEEGDVNVFFKKLYKNATPEQQRAMMKSFTESNGTSLSTDWNDVKGRRVETVPPEGVEAKKWE